MYSPALFAMIALATCLVNFAHAGSHYTRDYTTGTVTPGGFGTWDDGSTSAGDIVYSGNGATPQRVNQFPGTKKGLKYNKKRSVLPVVGSSGGEKRVRQSINVLSEDLRQPMINAGKGHGGKSKRGVLDRVNTLVTGATAKSANVVSGDNKGLVGILIAGNKVDGSEKTKRETGSKRLPKL